MLIFYQIFRRSTLYQSQVVTLGVHYRNTVLFYSFFTWGEKQQNEKKRLSWTTNTCRRIVEWETVLEGQRKEVTTVAREVLSSKVSLERILISENMDLWEGLQYRYKQMVQRSQNEVEQLLWCEICPVIVNCTDHICHVSKQTVPAGTLLWIHDRTDSSPVF